MQLLMRRPELAGFISVSPPAHQYDFNFLAPCPVSGLIAQGDEDTIVPHESVAKLAAKLQAQRGIRIDYQLVPGADHFYTNKLPELCRHVEDYLAQKMTVTRRAVNE
jgi:alpha/beta superfamily hydrolase